MRKMLMAAVLVLGAVAYGQADTSQSGLPSSATPQESAGHEGAAGAEGSAGDQGAAGAEGDHGAAGQQGAEGAQGSEGQHGAEGAHGAQGAAGHDAAAGMTHESAAPGGHGDDVPGFIMHHVGDSDEYEFEIPLNQGHNPVIHFPDWRIPLKDGGCPADRHAHAPLSDCVDLSLTKKAAFMLLAAALLILVMWFVPHRDKRQLVPKGTSKNLIEMFVLFIRDEIAIKNIGKQWGPKYTPYLLSAFFFILFMNLLGLFPWTATATSNLAITAGLALCTFFLTQYAAIRAAGLKTYLHHLTGGVHPLMWPIMVPVEVLGLFTKPFALTVRLFANMLAGHIVIFFLLGLIFILKSTAVAIVAVPFALAIYMLEIFVAFIQAYIFTMLSALFIGLGVAMAHHGDDHGEHGHGHEHGHGGHDHSHSDAAHDHGKAHPVAGG